MHLQDSNTSAPEIEGALGRSTKPRSTSVILGEISTAVAKGDASAVAQLLAEAEADHPGDHSIAAVMPKCKVVIRRGEWLDSALESMRRDLDDDRFASSLGHFREALGLSRGLSILKTRVDQTAELCCRELLPHNWRIAETILQEVANSDPPYVITAEFREKLEAARQDAAVASMIHKADRLELEGRTGEARDKLRSALTEFPDNDRLTERIHALDHPEETAKPDLVVKMPASEVRSPAPVSRPSEAELDTEGTLTDPLPGQISLFRTRVVISNSAWTAIKNFAALTATTVMLGTAGFLVWQHFNRPYAAKPTNSARSFQSRMAVAQPMAPSRSAVRAGNAFQDVPDAPSDQEGILEAVQAYARTSAKHLGDDVVDEIALKGNQASIRYRPREKDVGGSVTFNLVRQGVGWKVQSMQ